MDDLLSRVHQVLSITPARWAELSGTIDRALLDRRPAEGEWSALDCLQHLVDTEELAFQVRVRSFLAGEDLTAFDPDAEGFRPRPPADAVALAARFGSLRRQSLGLLEGLSPADFDRTANHSELGLVTLGALLHEWAAHDLMHTVQAERALMQPFIAGSGRWRSYFAEHEVRPTA